MAQRHATLNSRALATLLNPRDRVSKIPDGFGDFCFAPMHFRCVDCYLAQHAPFIFLSAGTEGSANDGGNILSRSMSTPRNPGVNSHQVTNSEPTFPILELPRLVRDLIYSFLIEPFQNPWRNNCIEVAVGLVHNRRCHPFRNGYSMYIPVSIETPYARVLSFHDRHYHIEYEHYENLRAVSQVSHQIRAELGLAFWSNIYIDLDHWEYLFMDFLEDRPSVCNGIKRLRMDWDGGYSAHWLDDKIVDFCEYVAEHLELDELIFVFNTTVSVARYLLAHDDVKWVKSFRKMKVKKLRLRLHLENDDDPEPDIADIHEDGDFEGIDEVMTDDEPGSEHGEDSGDEASDGEDSDAGDGGGPAGIIDFIDSEDEAEAARADLTDEFTPLLEELLRSTISRVAITEEQRYLDARALLVAPPEGERV